MQKFAAAILLILAFSLPSCTLGPISIGQKSSSTPTNKACRTTPGYVYDALKDLGISWSVQYRTSEQNGSSTPLQVTFMSSSDATVQITDNLHIDVTVGTPLAGIVTASVKATVNHSVTESITLKTGADVQYVVPPKSIGFANYGVRVQVVEGHLYTSKDSCNQISWGRVITYIPISSGWCVWLSSDPPCPSINL